MNFAFSDIDALDPVEEIFKAEVHETSSRFVNEYQVFNFSSLFKW